MNGGDHQSCKGALNVEPVRAAVASRHPANGKHFAQASFEQEKNARAVASVLARVDWSVVTRELSLSNQEIAVVKHVLAGEKMATIADDLCLSLGTVKTYCQRIYHKLQVSDHCGLAIVVLGCALLREVRGQDEAKG
jgi:DNA-binding NarL/FixJ family response regulator